jgi:ribosomal protein S6
MVLLDNREVKRGWQGLKDQVCGLFTKHGAEIKSARRWDERRLTYPIGHQLRGTYMLIYFESETSEIGAIRRELEYSDPVLRYITLTCEEVPADAFEPESEFDADAIRVEDTASAREAMIAAQAAAAEAGAERPSRGRGRAPRAEVEVVDDDAGGDDAEGRGGDSSEEDQK